MVVSVVAGACSGSTSEGSKSCVKNTECEQAYACKEAVCQQIECLAHGDCPGVVGEEGNDPWCGPPGIDPTLMEKKFCSPLQCGPTVVCPEGQVCDMKFKQCVDKLDTGDVVEGDIESPGDVVTEDTPGPDTQVTPQEGAVCVACETDADCPGKKCQPLSSGKFCLGECQSNDDCYTGWMCFQLSNEAKQCIPMAFNCDPKCLTEGCPEGKVCDQETGECVVPAGACGVCQQDWDCDIGFKCYQDGKYCAPICGSGSCPQNSTCQTVNGNIAVKLCVSGTPDCCFGEGCADQCPEATPYALAGKCVECIQDAHCGEGAKCGEGNTCVSDACQAPTPYQYQGNCVECLNSTHCTSKGEGWVCDLNTHKCKNSGPLPEECSYCVDPYAACTQINGIWSCVQCTDDTYCAGGTCDLSLFACGGGNPGCGGCTNDGECVSTMGTAVLACDVASGCCYDTAGWCDGVESMCNQGADSECLGIMDLIGGGGIPGMPLPEGGAGGLCTCTNGMGIEALACGFMPAPGCNSPECFGDAECIDLAKVPMIGDMFAQLGSVCANPSALLGGLGL